MGKFVRDHLQFKKGENVDDDSTLITRLQFQFVVEKDGCLTNFKLLKGGINAYWTAQHLFKAMPKWKPGMLNGKIVRVNYILPINCILWSE